MASVAENLKTFQSLKTDMYQKDFLLTWQHPEEELRAIVALADAFKVLPDGAEKSAIAVKLLGKSGSELIPMLDMGREGIDKFGGAISGEHGLGRDKRDMYLATTDPTLVALQRSIKSVFDPEGRLNPYRHLDTRSE